MSRSSIFSFSTLRCSFLPGKAALLALALVAAAEVALRFCTPNLGWFEGLSSLPQWVSRLEWELNARHPDVWLLGNSVLAYGVDTSLLSSETGRSCIALPFGNATVAGEIAMMRHFLPQASAPPRDLVFCGTQEDFNPNGLRSWISQKYLHYDSWRARLAPDRLFKLCASRQTIMNTAKDFVRPSRKLERPNPSEPPFDGVISPQKHEYMRNYMKDFDIDSDAFDALAAFAEHNGCRVHIVLAPVTRAYLDFHSTECPGASGKVSVIAELCDRHGFSFHDFSLMAPDDYALFADPDHLTAVGRERFTHILASFLSDKGQP